MQAPKRWSLEEFTVDAAAGAAAFRRGRLEEPLEQYRRFFQQFCPVFENLIQHLPSLMGDERVLADILETTEGRTAFRYLAAPPISDDDLKTLAESSLSPQKLRLDAEQARRVRDTVLHVVDPHRFPWVEESRAPAKTEFRTAVIASAALVAARKVETLRRSDAERLQEQQVRTLLGASGLEQVPGRIIRLLDDAPKAGQFCTESMLGPTRADIVVRLHDRRVMPIECKVSNSAVNSFKRLNHEAAGKAREWLRAFGATATVPAAVLGGVFKPGNLASAQSVGLALYWQHRLQDLADFVCRAKG